MEDKVIELLKKLKSKKSLSLEEIAERLEINDKEGLLELKEILTKKVKDNTLYKNDSGSYKHLSKTSLRKGTFHSNKSGGGKVLVATTYEKDGEQCVIQKEYSIKPKDANGAIDNDKVLIDINLLDSNDTNAKIFKVIDRNIDSIYGKIETIGSTTYVIPIDKKLGNIKVAVKGDYSEGQLVEVKLEEQTANDYFLGTITRKFNFRDDPNEDILMEAFMNGVDDIFTEESMTQADHIPDHVLPEDYEGREDLTEEETFTIDSEDTNDIDDAVGLKVLKNGNYQLTVSIADVSHYVPYNSPIDLDARKKGNSYYPAGTVIPMLPRKLSNWICSLRPNVERCAMSIRMEIDKDGNVVRKELFPSIIKSDIKMDYKTVNDILHKRVDEENTPLDYKSHVNTLKQMEKLYLILKKNRIKRGAIEFNSPEMKISLDEKGVPIKVEKRKQDIAEGLIEEFMIVANESVFSLLDEKGIPLDYRVHDIPNEDKLTEFFKKMEAMGIVYDKYTPKECLEDQNALQDLVFFINNKVDERYSFILNYSLIKCLSRAKYSVDNIGHSGLASLIYGHFTSPIRRYADLTVHRIIKDCYFDKKNSRKNIAKWRKRLPEICYQCSKMETVADRLERSVNSMKSAEYMSSRIGEKNIGIVTEVSKNGLTIQLDNLIEGKVKISNLNGDYFYNPNTFSLITTGKGEDYYLGDQLITKVKFADKLNKCIEFKVLEKYFDNSNRRVKNQNEAAKVKTLKKDQFKRERKERYLSGLN